MGRPVTPRLRTRRTFNRRVVLAGRARRRQSPRRRPDRGQTPSPTTTY